MGVPSAAVIASGDPATRAAVRSAVLERFTRLIAGADSATSTLAAWCGEPPTTRIHTREEAATLPEEAWLLGPLGRRRRTLRANRLCDYSGPLEYDDQDRAVLVVSAALEVAHERVALVEETYLEPVLW
jgi:hypothetical protein